MIWTIFIRCPECRQPKRKGYPTAGHARFHNPDVNRRDFITNRDNIERPGGLPPMGFKDWCPGHPAAAEEN